MKYLSLRSYLRAFGPNGFTRMVAAYTVVLRGGRRVEIPATFTVTKWTLTYEAAPGINVTLQISTIDIAATERANNEPPGALLRRVDMPAPATGAVSRPRPT